MEQTFLDCLTGPVAGEDKKVDDVAFNSNWIPLAFVMQTIFTVKLYLYFIFDLVCIWPFYEICTLQMLLLWVLLTKNVNALPDLDLLNCHAAKIRSERHGYPSCRHKCVVVYHWIPEEVAYFNISWWILQKVVWF